VLDAWEHDDRRLRTLERSYDPGTIRRLESLGVRVDWRCLAVGAGGVAVTRWLRQRVGSTGRVMTADLDPFAIERLPEGPFDVIHARALLTHIPDRARVLSALIGRLWPGGILLVEETDELALLGPAAGHYRTVWEHTCRLMESDGVAARSARPLPTVLQGAGLAGVGAEASAPMFAGGSPEAEFSRMTWRAERTRLLAAGLPGSVLDAALAELDDPDLWFPNWGVVAAWGRRPTVVVSY
jgi:hypothetical protein